MMNVNDQKPNKPVEQLDCDEFLNDGAFWSAEVAEKLAQNSDISNGLTGAHWKVINYVRSFYQDYGRGPEAVKVAKYCGVTMGDLCNLFPCGLVKGAYKVAGLPRPHGCV
jgi:tRNA 2-thiouridine synthesizing protein E